MTVEAKIFQVAAYLNKISEITEIIEKENKLFLYHENPFCQMFISLDENYKPFVGKPDYQSISVFLEKIANADKELKIVAEEQSVSLAAGKSKMKSRVDQIIDSAEVPEQPALLKKFKTKEFPENFKTQLKMLNENCKGNFTSADVFGVFFTDEITFSTDKLRLLLLTVPSLFGQSVFLDSRFCDLLANAAFELEKFQINDDDELIVKGTIEETKFYIRYQLHNDYIARYEEETKQLREGIQKDLQNFAEIEIETNVPDSKLSAWKQLSQNSENFEIELKENVMQITGGSIDRTSSEFAEALFLENLISDQIKFKVPVNYLRDFIHAGKLFVNAETKLLFVHTDNSEYYCSLKKA